MKRSYPPGEFYSSPPPNHRPTSQETPPQNHRLTSQDTPAPNMEANGNGINNALGFPISPPLSSDGATVEAAARRSRGRPPGSKNKPKPPVFIPRDLNPEPAMTPHVLELPHGVDVVEATTRFCLRRGVGLCVLSGNGAVANVTLKRPSIIPPSVIFHGRCELLSISATVLPGGGAYPPAASVPFAVTFVGHQGQMVVGSVIGPLVSVGTVYLFGATFNPPAFERLQMNDQDDAGAAEGGGREPPQALNGGDIGVPPAYGYPVGDVPSRLVHFPSPTGYRM